MSQILFNDVDEFIAEAGLDKDKINRKIIRITKQVRAGVVVTYMRQCSVIATYKVETDTVKLEHYVGEFWHDNEEQRAAITKKSDEIIDHIEEELKGNGFSFRAGVIK